MSCSSRILAFLLSFGFIEAFEYTSFQPQLIKCKSAREIVILENLPSLQNIVKQALQSNGTVKAIGALHSATDIICTSGTPVLMTKITHFKYDNRRQVVTVGAGMRLFDLLERLHNIGRTIEAVPTYGDITIGGAIGSGSHGTGLNHLNTIGDLIVSLVLVDGLGNVRNISDIGVLRAFRPNLGLLGIIYEVTLRTVPQFKLRIEHKLVDHSIIFQNNSKDILELARSQYRFQLWWFPTAHSVVLSNGNKVDSLEKGDCKTHFIPEAPRGTSQVGALFLEKIQWGRNRLKMFLLQKLSMLSLATRILGRSPIFEGDGCIPIATGYSHRMQANSCKACPWDHGNLSLPTQEFSVAMPLEEFGGAVKTIKSIIKEYPIELPLNGIYIRFISESDGFLSINADRKDSVVIEWAVIPRQNRLEKAYLGMPASQAIMQALIFKHNGRPHWAKNGLYYFNPKLLSKRYLNFDNFLTFRKQFDPHGVFLNDFGLRLLNKSSKILQEKHCALIDNCICSNNDHCSSETRGKFWGNGRPYTCGEVQGYKVCRDNDADKIRESFQELKSSLNFKKFRFKKQDLNS